MEKISFKNLTINLIYFLFYDLPAVIRSSFFSVLKDEDDLLFILNKTRIFLYFVS